MRGSDGVGLLPAAGMPWFMTVFGRDTIITCLQTLVFGPELAQTRCARSATCRPTRDDPAIDAEPGKIIHELRRGRAAEVWFPRYYGTVDATPLFLVLLSETWRWTGDDALVRELEPALRLALRWIDEFGDRDGDGFVEFMRRSDHGLEVQSWKDSPDSQRFADGRIAEGPIAASEVQGYVYDAKLRCAELARAVLGDEPLAERLEREAAALRERFDARLLGRARRRLLRSRAGRRQAAGRQPLLQHGPSAVERDRARRARGGRRARRSWIRRCGRAGACARCRPTTRPTGRSRTTTAPSGRTTTRSSPTAWRCAARPARRCRSCAACSRPRASSTAACPRCSRGSPRRDTPFPVAYPTASRPQAWAAAAPVLLLRVLLGLEPDPPRARSPCAPTACPSGPESSR